MFRAFDKAAAAAAAALRSSGLLGPGYFVAGRYQVEQLIGRGGCGVVYRAFDIHLAREVALKVLSVRAARRIASLRPRFEREVALLRGLEHPNVVRLYDSGHEVLPGSPDDEPVPWMALERVRGVELRTALAEAGRMPPARVHHVMLQLLSGLSAVHEHGMVHRDLKPSNIMLCASGADRDVVKLLDFGIGKPPDTWSDTLCDITAPGDALLGTPRYMAPEVLLRRRPGPWSDVYAAGLVMLELLTGSHPVPGDDLAQIVAHQLATPIEIPDWLLESPLGPVLQRATSKIETQRYRDAAAFHAALRDARITPALEASAASARIVAWPTDATARSARAGVSLEEALVCVARGAVSVTQEMPSGDGSTLEVLDPAPGAPLRQHSPRPRLRVALSLALLVVLATLTAATLRWSSAVAEPASDDPSPSPELTFEAWTVSSHPPGARVDLAAAAADSTQLCPRTPCHVVLPRGAGPLELRLSHPGYHEARYTLEPGASEARTLDAHLRPR